MNTNPCSDEYYVHAWLFCCTTFSHGTRPHASVVQIKIPYVIMSMYVAVLAHSYSIDRYIGNNTLSVSRGTEYKYDYCPLKMAARLRLA